MTKAVIFDMDGVLIDSETFYFERRMDFFKAKGIRPGSFQLKDYVGKSEEQTWRMLVPDNAAERKILQHEYAEFRDKNRIDFTKALRDSVPMVLNSLQNQGVSMALASSSPRSEIELMLADCQLKNYFSFVISGEELQESKPHPEIYLLSQEALGCDTNLAVEDSTLGIASAKAAGLYTAALKQSFPMNQEAADVVIDQLEELLRLV